MKKVVLFTLALLVIGITGVGCLSEEPTYHKMLTEVIDNQQTILEDHTEMGKKLSEISGMQFIIGLAEKDRYEEMNAKLDKLLNGQINPAEISRPTTSMLYQPNPQIFISIYNGDTRTSKMCTNIDEAVSFINTFR